MTHAMVISGVHLEPATGKPTRYKVENSWGEERGNKGYFVMTDQWFEECVTISDLGESWSINFFRVLQICVPGCHTQGTRTEGAGQGIRGWRLRGVATMGSYGMKSLCVYI